ncbi:hypothetical protein [uncultured Polaribacter sp.]|uniref:hypothetical protein n=1 Tax=uncultured Polaribacter sp. TaxID=174711 RepID=UPI002629A7A7|nr:hypothetical protein [uncultured Polaribacter sp.]
MFLRGFSLLLMVLFITSCDKFSFSKNKNIQDLDTIVDFSSVDTFPSFKPCDSIIDKTKKTDCFRTTIHQKIGAELLQHTFIIKDSIDEIIYVDLIISSEGIFTLHAIQSSNNIKKVLPQLDGLLRESVGKLPKIYAANKRGIPVSVKYSLPIRIKL